MRTISDWVDEIHQRDNTIDKLKEENARLREALESILELNILGNDNQGKMAFAAREALGRSE